MNIKIVSEKTGLTKRAIKYYEEEGLISPFKNHDNNYREYTKEDIAKLNLIGSLRAIDIPVNELKKIFLGDKNFNEVMEEALKNLNETITRLENSRLIISNIVNDNSKDFSYVSERVKSMRETLELSVRDKKEFLSDAILRIFPGNLGKILKTTYGQFLNIVIDSDVKRETWVKVVEYLDNMEEVDENHAFIKNINTINFDRIVESAKKIHNNMLALLNGNEDVYKKYVKDIVTNVKLLNKNEELKNKMWESLRQSHDLFGGMQTDINFDEYLEILSDDYKKYREIVKKLQLEASKEIMDELGVTFEEFFEIR